jgi:hypothetical protein
MYTVLDIPSSLWPPKILIYIYVLRDFLLLEFPTGKSLIPNHEPHSQTPTKKNPVSILHNTALDPMCDPPDRDVQSDEPLPIRVPNHTTTENKPAG